MTTPTDRDDSLVAALRRGDPTAAEDLVAAYGDRASRLARGITGNAQDAEDDELPADYRAIVLLRDVEGLAPGDIAAILGLTVDNVTTRVHRARLLLRKQLEAHLSDQSSASPRASS
jgi:DNA-directed RNA polymerase specialized sigma24 family protein